VRVQRQYTIGAIVVLFVGTLLVANRTSISDFYEEVSFSIHPTAQKAFIYGERHLTARDDAYDLDKAEYYYLRSVALDTDIPYLFHELARIAFLRGKFSQALALINIQIEKFGDTAPNSFYVRGLIEGYMGDYTAARSDYAYFLQKDPNNWAAINYYAWILLKTHDPEEALRVTARGTSLYPENPWLLNSLAIAQYELGSLADAYATAQRAIVASQAVTEKQWLTAYPGNDPGSAKEGIAALQRSALENMHSIEVALTSSTVQ
jgi:tetratricopeptide (TPR) repeat protein